MLRKFLIATALLAASGASLAHNDAVYGRVITVEPHVAFSFGTGYNDGFRVMYESGGSRYWTHTPYRPSHTIVLPPHHRVQHPHYRDRHGWDDRRDWRDDRRHDRRHDRRDDRRDDRRHDRY